MCHSFFWLVAILFAKQLFINTLEPQEYFIWNSCGCFLFHSKTRPPIPHPSIIYIDYCQRWSIGGQFGCLSLKRSIQFWSLLPLTIATISLSNTFPINLVLTECLSCCNASLLSFFFWTLHFWRCLCPVNLELENESDWPLYFNKKSVRPYRSLVCRQLTKVDIDPSMKI